MNLYAAASLDSILAGLIPSATLWHLSWELEPEAHLLAGNSSLADMAENCICTDFAIFAIISAELKIFCTLIQATN